MPFERGWNGGESAYTFLNTKERGHHWHDDPLGDLTPKK